MKTVLLVIACVFGTESPLLAAPMSTVCRDVGGPRPWHYCVTQTLGSKSTTLLYHFHGRTMNERAWVAPGYFPGEIRAAWDRSGLQAPIVVTISFGEDWFLVERNSRPASGLLELIPTVVIPTVEKELGRNWSGHRKLVGESMGGFNALQVSMKYPDLFSRVALLCPALSTVSPYSDPHSIQDYVRRTGAQSGWVSQMVSFLKPYFGSDSDWAIQNPLARLKQEVAKSRIPFYVSCGNADEFGFFEGASLAAQTLATAGRLEQFVPINGGKHCAVDASSVALFLEN